MDDKAVAKEMPLTKYSFYMGYDHYKKASIYRQKFWWKYICIVTENMHRDGNFHKLSTYKKRLVEIHFTIDPSIKLIGL